jgi:uncharacterized protein YqeY
MAALKPQIQEAMKSAMKAGEKERLAAIRLMLAAIKQVEVDERRELEDPDVLAVLDKMLKQRRESITQYEAAGREDLAARERFEVEVIQQYLPTQFSEQEIEALIDQAIAETGASDIKGMGKVMGWLKPKLQGRADMGSVSATVKARLAV